ncbi:hypothetical protein ACFL27_17080 [candidate division CSSED10-310 bacterium]|uniref:Uncharacterized protein n=1 Tax=candidate division CSSED10-310 bacterium TaxID=2855610 RepID=A0ABV6Z0R5_UNCC1
MITRYRRVLDEPAYIFVLHNGPNQSCRKIDSFWETIAHDYHWHIEIIPILMPVAAFEVGTGIYINPVLPEEATDILLEKKELITKTD